MRFKYLLMLGTSVVCLIGLVCVLPRGVAQQPKASAVVPKLHGARQVVEAIQFESIQAAIDALPQSGGMVRLPPGEFSIDAPLQIRTGDVCLEGAGTGTHITNVSEDGQPAIVIAHAESNPARRDPKHELWRVRLTNFRVSGNAKSGPGIVARGINEFFLDGVTVSNHGGDGVRLEQCYEDPRICDSLITYNKGVGVNLIGCHDIVVSSNQFEENQDALHCQDGFNLCMNGNCIDDHLGRGVVIENTYGSVVAGNMIEECHDAAIVLDRDCYGITLSANVIAHNGSGIDLRDAHGCSVSANTFTLMKTDALRIGPGSGRISVNGNSFCNSFIGDSQVKRGTDDLAAAGMVLDGASDVAVTGNVFSGLTTKALTLTDRPATRIHFAENVLTDVTSDHAKLPPNAKDGSGR